MANGKSTLRPGLQIYSQLTAPKNPLMLAPHTVSGTASNQDFVLLNGGYQPTISMKVRNGPSFISQHLPTGAARQGLSPVDGPSLGGQPQANALC